MTTAYRSLFGWLENNRVSGSQCWCDFPGQHQDRIVPRNDLTANTNWLQASERYNITIGRNGFAMNLVRPTGVVTQIVQRTVNVKVSLGPRFPIVQHFQIGQIFPVTINQIGQLVDQLATFGCVQSSPCGIQFECLSGSLHCFVNVCLWAEQNKFINLVEQTDSNATLPCLLLEQWQSSPR